MTFDEYPLHDSIRGWFGRALYFTMQENDNVWCLTSDLGYGLLDRIKEDFPDRFLNVGASEQCMIGAAVGLSLSNKVVFCYSITTFLIYRPMEWLRNFLNHEKIPVMLIGSGYEDDYKHDGISHQPYGLFQMGGLFSTQLHNIRPYFPKEKEAVPEMLKNMITQNRPAFMCLRR